MTADELLAELKDIQSPPQPDWWLIGPGYWLVLAAIAAIFLLLWWRRRYQASNRLAILAEKDLQDIRRRYEREQDSGRLLLNLSRWLKQVAVAAFPEQNPAPLCGQAWIEFLDRAGGQRLFCSPGGRPFAGDIYARRPEAEAAQALALCERWLGAVKPKLSDRARI